MSSPLHARSGPGRIRQLANAGRITRYGIAGGLSFLTHAAVLVGLVELTGLDPVLASAAGFAASITVSYLLQHRWVFRAAVADRIAAPRFLVVTAVGFATNTIVMGLGTWAFDAYYLAVQVVAFVLIPISNYTMNTLWTFHEG